MSHPPALTLLAFPVVVRLIMNTFALSVGFARSHITPVSFSLVELVSIDSRRRGLNTPGVGTGNAPTGNNPPRSSGRSAEQSLRRLRAARLDDTSTSNYTATLGHKRVCRLG